MGGGDMGIQLVPAVAGEMLAGAGHMRGGVTDAADIGPDAFDDPVRIAAEGAGVDNGVSPVAVDIGDGIEHPVDPDGGSLPPGDIADPVGCFIPRGGAGFRGGGDEGAFLRQDAVPAVIAVAGDEHGNAAVLLEETVLLPDGFLVSALPAHAARAGGFHQGFDLLLVRAGHGLEKDEELAELFLKGHGRKGFLHPANIFLREIKRLYFQIHHGGFLPF